MKATLRTITSHRFTFVCYSWVLLLLGAAFYCYEYFLQVAPDVMTAQLQQAYHLNSSDFMKLPNYYCVAYTVMQLFVGLLFDRFGVKSLLAGACALCATGAYLLAYSHQLAVAEAAEMLMGLGSAFAFVGLLKLAADWLPARRFGLVTGLATAVGMAGVVAGQLSLGQLVAHEGWRAAFAIMAVAGIGLALILFFAVRDKGAAETTAGTGFQPLTFSELFHHLSAACRNSQLWLVGIVSGSLFMSLTVFSQEKGAAYLQIVHHLPAAQATGLASVVLIGWAVGAPIVGFCSDAIRRRQVFITVGSFFALACLAVALYVPNLSVNVLLYALFFYGFFSSMQCLTFALGRELLSRRIAGTAVSLINLLVMIAAGLVLPLLDKLLLITHGGDLACTYKVAFLVLPVSLLFGFLLSLFIKETHCKLRDY